MRTIHLVQNGLARSIAFHHPRCRQRDIPDFVRTPSQNMPRPANNRNPAVESTGDDDGLDRISHLGLLDDPCSLPDTNLARDELEMSSRYALHDNVVIRSVSVLRKLHILTLRRIRKPRYVHHAALLRFQHCHEARTRNFIWKYSCGQVYGVVICYTSPNLAHSCGNICRRTSSFSSQGSPAGSCRCSIS